MAYKDLDEHLAETFGQYQSFEILAAAGEFRRTYKTQWARDNPRRYTKDQLQRKYDLRKVKRDAQREGPKPSWKVTGEQKHWICTNGLTTRETARQLGVTPRAVRKIRQLAGVKPPPSQRHQPIGGAPIISGGMPPAIGGAMPGAIGGGALAAATAA